MAERELQLELSDPMKELLVEKGWDPSMGARPLRRAIQRYIEDPLADFVLREEPMSGSTVVVDPPADGGSENDIRLSVIAPKPAPQPVGVGAEGGSAPEDEAPDEPGPEIPDAPPAPEEPGDES
jgi:ATP-dependent Clp protease ATP-binding subunit ClpC